MVKNTNMDRLKKYKSEFSYSYTLGLYSTIELLKHKKGSVQELIISPKEAKIPGMQEIKKACKEAYIPVTVNQILVDSLATNKNTYAIGVFEKYKSELDENKNHVVLVNPGDMGNLGTICRTMVGFGFHNLAIINPAVDIFSPQVVEAFKGAVFNIRFEYFVGFTEYAKKYQRKYYTFTLKTNRFIGSVTFKKPYSLIFNGEGLGLTTDLQGIGKNIRIPQSKDTDSLSLPVAVGIALYEASKQ